MRAAKLHTDIRQEQIVHAALNVVASHGLKGLTVQRVARQVGLAPSAMYRHFQRKDEVLTALFLGLIQPPAFLWHISGGAFDITAHADQAWQVFREAIMAR
jgi:AcrR family transcriptional regulator